MDTGSSDLWLDPSNVTFPSSLTNTNISTRIEYGYVEHIIHRAGVKILFRDLTVAEGPVLLAKLGASLTHCILFLTDL